MTSQFQILADMIHNTDYQSFHAAGFFNILCSIDVLLPDNDGSFGPIQVDRFAVRTFAENGYVAEERVAEQLSIVRKDLVTRFPSVYSLSSYLATMDEKIIEIQDLSIESIVSSSSYLQVHKDIYMNNS